MIAYVDPDRAFEYVAPQLERLEARAHLFIVTVRDGRAIALDAFVDGEHSAHETDITPMLPRLGCHGDFATWAQTPRVLTPTDVDLMCYALGLEMPSDASLPPRAPIEHARALNLLAAIYDEPDSDDVRLVYADYLQEQDDPGTAAHGQLIALQIARAQRSAEPGAGERALIQWHGDAIAQPLTPYLRPGFELRRGFLAVCAVDERPPDEILASRAWATVESIETRNYTVLANPRLTAVTRVATDVACLHQLVAEREAQPFETLVGATVASSMRHHGLALRDRKVWRALTAIGPLVHLRTLALAPAVEELPHLVELVAGPLGAQLEHLDVQLALGMDPRALRACFDASRLPRLVVRLARGDGTRTAIALERGGRLRLEIHDGGLHIPHHHMELLGLLRVLGRNISRVELAMVNGQPRLAVRDGIREIFSEVVPALSASWWSL